MHSLREVQRELADDILTKSEKNAGQRIATNPRSGSRLVQIYRNNYFLSLTKVLRNIHPTVNRLVGNEFFDHTAREYIYDHPPLSGNLHNYGKQFAAFLDEFDPSREIPYISDIARLDWAHHRAYHAADSSPVSTDKINSVPAERYSDLMFVLSPSVSILTSQYPVYSIWQFSQEEAETDNTLTFDSGGEQLLVFRPKLDVVTKRITRQEYVFINALDKDLALSDAVELAVNIHSRFDLNSVLGECLSTGLIVDLRLQNNR